MKSHLLSAAFAALLLSSPLTLAATAAEEAQALIDQGDLNGALKRLDRQLSSSPQDAESRFLRGLVLVKLNRSADAVKAFSELTRDYPQLPEPYNNLAVLYAQQGDYEKARDALEAALATHPSYATAHENLGDIYTALAGAAYNRALILDQNNSLVRRKLDLIGSLGTASSGAAPAPTVAAVTAPAPVAVAPAPTAAPAPAPVAASTRLPEPPPAPAAPAGGGVDEATAEAISAALFAWAQAWSAQNLEAYFATYAPAFTPEGGLTRNAWEIQRRDRISRPKKIAVRATNPQIVRMGGDRVRVSFLQEYESDSFSDQVNKVLELERSGGAWLIQREYTR
ncbi:MAG TPA: tetratricopeptide repeat protein [Nevskiaceae bacterium]|nr:tetratricopeptide repeat protein [Nevskiaceae bacterium]